ncbi:MAG: hypothetical protein LCH37_12680 [Bacteroidetes bacterium]|nr:hypothetical protein [Bacteroidota bacterium]
MDKTLKCYKIKTPNNLIIEFAKIDRSVANTILIDSNKRLMSNLDLFQNEAFLMEKGEVIYKITANSYCLLFQNEFSYNSFIRGDNYFLTTILFDSNDYVHASFDLKPDKVNELLVKLDYKKSDLYPSIENYNTYTNSQNGNVMYLKSRGSELMDGYWFDNISDFEFYLNRVFKFNK